MIHPFFTSSAPGYCKNNYRGNAVLRPAQKEIAEVIRSVASNYRDDFQRIAQGLDCCELTRVKPNKTGTRMIVSVKAGPSSIPSVKRPGRTYPFSLYLHENGKPRTDEGVIEEVCVSVLEKHGLEGKSNLLDQIRSEATDRLKRRTNSSWDSAYISQTEVAAVCMDYLESFMDQRFLNLKAVAQKLRDFVASGATQKNTDAHQTGRALAAVRTAALHAFKHGANIEEIITAVNECLVANVIDQ